MMIRFCRYPYGIFLILSFWLLLPVLSDKAAARPQGAKRLTGKITLREAQRLADEVSARSEMKIGADAKVVFWLNHYLRTREGKRFLSNSLTHKNRVDKIIYDKIANHKLPRELIAIPLVESGFFDAKKRKNRNSPVGIWQFEATTARRLNLIVNARIDERKQIARSTDAALSLLKHLYNTFGDWQLALAAYNQGEGHVKKAIKLGKNRDAFALAESGHLNNYAAKTTAAIIALHQAKAI